MIITEEQKNSVELCKAIFGEVSDHNRALNGGEVYCLGNGYLLYFWALEEHLGMTIKFDSDGKFSGWFWLREHGRPAKYLSLEEGIEFCFSDDVKDKILFNLDLFSSNWMYG